MLLRMLLLGWNRCSQDLEQIFFLTIFFQQTPDGFVSQINKDFIYIFISMCTVNTNYLHSNCAAVFVVAAVLCVHQGF